MYLYKVILECNNDNIELPIKYKTASLAYRVADEQTKIYADSKNKKVTGVIIKKVKE